MLFNRGDGRDIYNGYSYRSTLSLGGGISYADLWFYIEGSSLVFDMGASETITFDLNYYDLPQTLQIITEAMPGYDPASTNNLYNKRVQRFDLQRLVNQFRAANAADPEVTWWQLESHLAGAYLGGSNTDALGGAMAYEYGMHGSLAQLADAGIQLQLKDPLFGVAGQHIIGSNVVTGGAGDDMLIGGAGDDVIDGKTGADTMSGGLGDDTYVVDNVGDVVLENAGEGKDTIVSSVSYTLAAGVENLTLTGNSAINGTGNELDNVLIGNGADNILTGGAGNDTYVVDSVSDVIIENAGEGTDKVESAITYTLGARC